MFRQLTLLLSPEIWLTNCLVLGCIVSFSACFSPPFFLCFSLWQSFHLVIFLWQSQSSKFRFIQVRDSDDSNRWPKFKFKFILSWPDLARSLLFGPLLLSRHFVPSHSPGFYLHRPIDPYTIPNDTISSYPQSPIPGSWLLVFASGSVCCPLIVRVKIYKYLHSINFSDFFFHSPVPNRSRVSFVFLVHASHNFFRSCSVSTRNLIYTQAQISPALQFAAIYSHTDQNVFSYFKIKCVLFKL